ncbi:MAG: hypothetical protein ABIQ95_01060 [Bdellovibrionia bacterium]
MSEDEDKIRKRQREREDEQDARHSEEKSQANAKLGLNNKEVIGEKLDELLLRADPLVEQLNNLYNIYISGAEQIPPTERRKNLDQIMVTLQMISKPTPGALYKYTAIYSKYESYRNRWDKMMKDLESGKIKRRVGPSKHK